MFQGFSTHKRSFLLTKKKLPSHKDMSILFKKLFLTTKYVSYVMLIQVNKTVKFTLEKKTKKVKTMT